MTSAKHASQNSKMAFGRDPSDSIEEEVPSANHASKSSDMELGRDPSQPCQFRCTFGSKLDEEMVSANYESQDSKMEFGRDPSRHLSSCTLLKTKL